MASRFIEKDPVKCWNFLAYALSLGYTIPFYYKTTPVDYRLSHGVGSGCAYFDNSSAEYLLDDIQFALFDEGLPKIELLLSGPYDGPICNFWIFTFTRAGLVEAYGYYNDD